MEEKRRELANIERELQLEMEIEHKREKLGGQTMFKWMWSGLLTSSKAKLRRRHAETEDPEDFEDPEELDEEAEKPPAQARGKKSEMREDADDVDMEDVTYEADDEK